MRNSGFHCPAHMVVSPSLPGPSDQEGKRQSQCPPQLFIEWEGGTEEVQDGETAWGTRAVGPAWWGGPRTPAPLEASRLVVTGSPMGRGGVHESLSSGLGAPPRGSEWK